MKLLVHQPIFMGQHIHVCKDPQEALAVVTTVDATIYTIDEDTSQGLKDEVGILRYIKQHQGESVHALLDRAREANNG